MEVKAYEVSFYKGKGDDPYLSTVSIVIAANKWLTDNSKSQHLDRWFDNAEKVVFLISDRTTAIQLKLAVR